MPFGDALFAAALFADALFESIDSEPTTDRRRLYRADAVEANPAKIVKNGPFSIGPRHQCHYRLMRMRQGRTNFADEFSIRR
jgi:hypothetical protein